ncbi:syntaphilin-like isoform X1 [Acipenser ruthenus]|uniref:syntaphilin-like isoform X1 n=1 Tax=Acipenser ruthenus TaxID=7906 RepID=UPI00274118D5|nr:syntaphilin-like isoform X1 [Acipenser ruthenus]XP_058846815.1 syntaphilin-like isoform X1 [Acipenser ruthenus]XP_058846816.1 syntaphilin-like isoform X1 [Acipenser ruthenus]XP_058846817.1 syntaphilin-like isoform X1 [Acipenser ruthenus]
MSAPASRRTSTGSRRFNPLKALQPKRRLQQMLSSPSARQTLPVSPGIRDANCTSSLSSSSNSGSCKGSDGSPTTRRHIKYASCSDNHGIKPPTPEQYLTPLQQKEVCIRHLRATLKETMDKAQERDSEIEDLKTQLSRMQEDWIEEECHRVEAQMALKEARKEIKQLKQVIDNVRSNLTEKDQGIHEYFVEINSQNKKLETLLHSMELAQNDSPREEGARGLTLESAGGSPARSLTRSSTYTKLSDQASAEKATDFPSFSAEETMDSGFVGGESGNSRTELQEQGFLSEDVSLLTTYTAGSRLPQSSTYEKLASCLSSMEMGSSSNNHQLFQEMKEQAIQTDFIQYNPDLDTIMEKVMKSQACSPTSAWISEAKDMDLVHFDHHYPCAVDLAPSNPNAVIAVTGIEGAIAEPTVQQPTSARGQQTTIDILEMVEVVCDEGEEEGENSEASAEMSIQKSYWSRHFLVDLLAVAVPVVPTVAWLCRGPRREGQPVYNISSLLRGCCTVALHSIRKISGGRPVNGGTQI